MGYPNLIEWTDATWNPVGGCSLDSPGCINCWAQKLAGTRLKNHPLYAGTTSPDSGRPIFNGTMTALPDEHKTWDFPLTWRGAAKPKLGADMPSLFFAGDMSDIFHHARPLDDIVKVFARAALSPHIVQILTKRSDRVRALLTTRHFRLCVQDAVDTLRRERAGRRAARNRGAIKFPLPNVWVGVSAERQQEADRRRDDLASLAVAGWTTFVSYEPAVGAVNWDGWQFLGWMISGGESGDRARPTHPDWHRAARDFCAAHGIPFFFKQWGEFLPVGQHLPGCDKIHGATAVRPGRVRLHYSGSPKQEPKYAFAERGVEFVSTSDNRLAFRVGKKAAGHLLDGVEHHAFPKITIAADMEAVA